jgi:hypothetical protein
MANKKISEFPVTTTLAGGDAFLINHIGTTSTVSFSTVSDTISQTVSSSITNSLTGDTVIQKLSSNFIKKPDSATNGQVLTYNGSTSTWMASSLSAQGFTASLSAKGYTYLPNGILMQWGTGTGGTAFSFPIPFPNACWSVNITPVPYGGIGVGSGVTFTLSGATPYTNAGNGNAVNVNVYWIAFGN